MKPISPELQTALNADLTYLCRLWAVTGRDGVTFRFTDHHSDLVFDGDTYQASKAFTATAAQLAANTVGSDVDVSVLVGEGGLDYQKLERGIYDNAPIDLSIVSWRNLDAGSINLFSGMVRTVALENKYQAQLSLGVRLSRLNKEICEQYSPTCRANFGDARCKVDLDAHTDPFTVSVVSTNQAFGATEFAAKAENYYAAGTVTWLTGANAGTRIDIVTNAIGGVYTLLPCPMPVEVGDTGTITRGCQKTKAMCIEYENLPNFRGEPYVPGDDGI